MKTENIQFTWNRIISSDLDKTSKLKAMNKFRKHLINKHGIKIEKSNFYSGSLGLN